MTDIALEGSGIYKKFKKGELFDTLRDLIPTYFANVFQGDRQGDRTGELSQREFWALEDVFFQVKRGEALGIIGNNGAGKSTLLKLLCKIMKPTKGEIKVNGKLSALIEVGAGFHPDLSGRENIFLNGLILGMSRQEVKKKFDEIVYFAGLQDFIDTPVKRYSSGMYARLGFSVAAHVDPEILLVDEVLSVGDWGFQRKCAEKMGDLIKSGVTIIFVSHNLRAVTNICNTGILLSRGKVIKTGSPEEIVKYYLDDVSQQPDEISNSKIYIKKVNISRDGIEESYLKAGDKVVIKVNVFSEIDSQDAAMHLYVIDNLDHQIFHVYLEQLESEVFSFKKGESKEFKVELSMHLAAGVYQLGVMICKRNDVSKIYSHRFPAAKLHIEAHDAVRCIANLYPKIIST